MIKKGKTNFSPHYIRTELLGKTIVTFFGIFLITLTICLVFFIASKGLSTFFKDKQSPLDFLFSSIWKPERGFDEGGPLTGGFVFIFGSVSISSLALLISTPFSIAIAIFMTEISPKFGQKVLQPVIEVFVGIPSVVYGWVGLCVLVPFIGNTFGGLGKSLLAGAIVLAVMIFPTITSVSVDALKTLPKDYKEASYALGSTRWQTIRKVLVPAALPGMLTGIVLGLARAFGEALAVQMVIGNNFFMPKSILDRSITLTSVITMEMGEAPIGTVHNNALWSLALLLLIISFLFIALIHKIGAKGSFSK